MILFDNKLNKNLFIIKQSTAERESKEDSFEFLLS